MTLRYMSNIAHSYCTNVQQVSMAASGATSNVYMLAYSFLCLRIPDKDQFHAVTSITSASMEFGIFVGSVMSQIIVSLSGGKYTTLPYYNATSNMIYNCICVQVEIVVKKCIYYNKTRKNSWFQSFAKSEWGEMNVTTLSKIFSSQAGINKKYKSFQNYDLGTNTVS